MKHSSMVIGILVSQGLCYTNVGGCEYEYLIFRPGNRTCGEIQDVCQAGIQIQRNVL